MRPRSDWDSTEVDQAAVVLFAGVMALCIAVAGSLCRLGFHDNSPGSWARFVGLAWFLTGASLLLRSSWRCAGGFRQAAYWSSHSALSLAALIVVALCGVESTTLSRSLSTAILLLGVAAFVLALATVVRFRPALSTATLGLIAVLFSFYAIGAAWGCGYQNPLFDESLCFGDGQIDTLFHASVANMLRSYGVASTGLDGIPPLHYHFASHWLFARLCNLLGVRVIDFYNRGYAVVFVPFGVFCLGTFANALQLRFARPCRHSAAPIHPATPGDSSFWLLMAAGYIGLLPYAAGIAPIVAQNSIIVSESYAVAVGVSLLALGWAWPFFRELRAGTMRGSVGTVIAIVLLSGVLGTLGLLKISVMLVLAVVGVFFFLRLRLYRTATFNGLFAAGALATYLAYRAASNPDYSTMSGFVLFGFLRTNIGPQWWPYFWLAYYPWAWIVAALRIREEGIRSLGDLARAVQERRLLDVEFIFIAAVVGAGPGLLLTAYSSTHYFSEYQHWLALGLLLSIALRRMNGFRAARPEEGLAGEPVDEAGSARPETGSHAVASNGGIRQFSLSRLFVAAVALSVLSTMASNTLVLLRGVVETNLAARGRRSGQTGFGLALLHGQFSAARRLLDETAGAVEGRLRTDKNVIALLRGLDDLPLREKRESLLFIPKSNRQYWRLLQGPYWPKNEPFLAPALSGIAMIDGLYVPQKDESWLEYGYYVYPRPNAENRLHAKVDSLTALRTRCGRLGFLQLIVIDQLPDGSCEAVRYRCER